MITRVVDYALVKLPENILQLVYKSKEVVDNLLELHKQLRANPIMGQTATNLGKSMGDAYAEGIKKLQEKEGVPEEQRALMQKWKQLGETDVERS